MKATRKPSHLFALLLTCLLVESCAGPAVYLQTSRAPKKVGNYGRYYLPRKIMSAVATYTITYQDHFEWDLPSNLTAAQIKKKKRHYKKEPNQDKQQIKKIVLADDLPITYALAPDLSKPLWLSESKPKEFDALDIAYAENASGVLKSINATFTPAGGDIATTVLKVGVVVVKAAASAFILAAFHPGAPDPDKFGGHLDSMVNRTVTVVLKKNKDIGELSISNTNKYLAISFSGADLSISSLDKTLIPKVEIFVEKESSVNSIEPANELSVNSTFSSSVTEKDTTTIAGIFYRQPAFYKVSVTVTRPIGNSTYSISSEADRISFMQLSRIGVVPIAFSKKGGKHTTAVTFNNSDGGLTEYKLNKEKGSGTAATEGGNLAAALLDAYGKQRQANTELQQLKDSNALSDEKIKQLKNKQDYETLLQTATP